MNDKIVPRLVGIFSIVAHKTDSLLSAFNVCLALGDCSSHWKFSITKGKIDPELPPTNRLLSMLRTTIKLQENLISSMQSEVIHNWSGYGRDLGNQTNWTTHYRWAGPFITLAGPKQCLQFFEVEWEASGVTKLFSRCRLPLADNEGLPKRRHLTVRDAGRVMKNESYIAADPGIYPCSGFVEKLIWWSAVIRNSRQNSPARICGWICGICRQLLGEWLTPHFP